MAEKAGGRDAQDDDLYDDEEEDTQDNRYLTFRLGNEDFGIEIRHVLEIIGIQKVTEVPDMPDFVKGVINLRGQVIPVMDVRMRFKMESREYDDRTCVIVVTIKEVQVGLIVDIVKEVRDIPEENVSAPPRVGKGSHQRYIKGLGKVDDEVKILLDVEKLLFEEELEQLAAT